MADICGEGVEPKAVAQALSDLRRQMKQLRLVTADRNGIEDFAAGGILDPNVHANETSFLNFTRGIEPGNDEVRSNVLAHPLKHLLSRLVLLLRLQFRAHPVNLLGRNRA